MKSKTIKKPTRLYQSSVEGYQLKLRKYKDQLRKLAKDPNISPENQYHIIAEYPNDPNLAGELIYNPNLLPELFDILFPIFGTMLIADIRNGYYLEYYNPATQKKAELIKFLV